MADRRRPAFATQDVLAMLGAGQTARAAANAKLEYDGAEPGTQDFNDVVRRINDIVFSPDFTDPRAPTSTLGNDWFSQLDAAHRDADGSPLAGIVAGMSQRSGRFASELVIKAVNNVIAEQRRQSISLWDVEDSVGRERVRPSLGGFFVPQRQEFAAVAEEVVTSAATTAITPGTSLASAPLKPTVPAGDVSGRTGPTVVVYAGLRIDHVDGRDAVAVRVEQFRYDRDQRGPVLRTQRTNQQPFPMASGDVMKDSELAAWFRSARTMIYITELAERIRTSGRVDALLTPRFYHAAITRPVATPAPQLIVVHDFWPYTLARLLRPFEGSTSAMNEFLQMPLAQQLEEFAEEAARLDSVIEAAQSLARRMQVLLSGEVTKDYVVHGDLKTNNIVARSYPDGSYVLAIIDWGVSALYRMVKPGEPPNRWLYPPRFKYNTDEWVDPFVDLGYMQYSMRQDLALWVYAFGKSSAAGDAGVQQKLKAVAAMFPMDKYLHADVYHYEVVYNTKTTGRWVQRAPVLGVVQFDYAANLAGANVGPLVTFADAEMEASGRRDMGNGITARDSVRANTGLAASFWGRYTAMRNINWGL